MTSAYPSLERGKVLRSTGRQLPESMPHHRRPEVALGKRSAAAAKVSASIAAPEEAELTHERDVRKPVEQLTQDRASGPPDAGHVDDRERQLGRACTNAVLLHAAIIKPSGAKTQVRNVRGQAENRAQRLPVAGLPHRPGLACVARRTLPARATLRSTVGLGHRRRCAGGWCGSGRQGDHAAEPATSRGVRRAPAARARAELPRGLEHPRRHLARRGGRAARTSCSRSAVASGCSPSISPRSRPCPCDRGRPAAAGADAGRARPVRADDDAAHRRRDGA